MTYQDYNRQNLRSAERLVAQEMGVDPDANSSLSYEQRGEFSRRLAAKILAYPDRFTAETVATAQAIAGRTLDPLADASFSWSDFSSAVTDNALAIGDSVADVGRGVTGTLSSVKWLLPLAAVVAVGILIVGFKRKVAP